MIVKGSALKPQYHLNFPTSVYSWLPSSNIVATVRSSTPSNYNRLYKVLFYGEREQKGFGKGWRHFVEDHKLVKGDQLKFEVEPSDDKFELKIDLLRCNRSNELEEGTRSTEETDHPINVVDDDDNTGSDANDNDDDDNTGSDANDNDDDSDSDSDENSDSGDTYDERDSNNDTDNESENRNC